MEKIIKNMIKCNKCGDILESVHTHDFKTCKCGCWSLDGGKEYLSRSFINSKNDYTELSEVIEIEDTNDTYYKIKI